MKKERYKIKLIDEDPMYFELYDNLKKKYFESPNCIVKVLNQQDTRIKELKEEIKLLDEDRQFRTEMWTKFADKCKSLTQQLQQLHNQKKIK